MSNSLAASRIERPSRMASTTRQLDIGDLCAAPHRLPVADLIFRFKRPGIVAIDTARLFEMHALIGRVIGRVFKGEHRVQHILAPRCRLCRRDAQTSRIDLRAGAQAPNPEAVASCPPRFRGRTESATTDYRQ